MGLLRSRASKKRAKAKARLAREQVARLTVGELLDDTDGLLVVLAGIESATKTAIPS